MRLKVLPKLLFKLFLFFILLFTGLSSSAATFDWTGVFLLGNIADWSNANNWAVNGTPTSVPPGPNDNVRIGVVAYGLLGAQPTISTSTQCASITFGINNSPILTVNAGVTLTVSGDITINHGSSTNNNTTYTTILQGAGSATVQNVIVGLSSQNPPSGLNGSLITLFSSQINSLTINGNIILNSTTNGGLGYDFPKFRIDNNTVYLYGQIVPQHFGTFTGTLNVNDPGRSRFSVGDPTINSTNTNTTAVYFYNTQPVSTNWPSKAFIDFVGTNGNNTVVYAAAAGTQTVYTTRTDFGAAPYNYYNIQFQGGATKLFNAGIATIGNNWTSTGGKVDLTTNAATTNFVGTNQTLSDNASDSGNGVVFQTVNFLTSGTKTLSTGNFSVSPSGILTVGTSSSTVLAANGNLTLQSNAANSATVARLPSGCSITGNVNVQRYIIGGNTKAANGAYTARAYRLLSSPVNVSSSTSGGGNINPGYLISSGMLVSGSGGAANGFTQANNNPTLYVFNESGTNNNTTFISGKHKGITKIYSNGYINTSDGSTNIPLPVGNGYMVYYVGNSSNPATKATATPTTGPENMIVTATGTLNQNNVTVNLWYTPFGATAPTNGKLSYSAALGVNAGLNMVGNPYASTLDLNALMTGNTGITNSVYELDNLNPNQSYLVYSSSGSSSPKAGRYVVSGQGFIVRANGINKTLTFSETMKAEQIVPSNLLMGIPKQADELAGFYMKMEQDSLLNAYCGIYFNQEWTDQFNDEDAIDLNSTSSTLLLSSYTTDGRRVALNKLSDYTPGKTIKLNANATTTGLYKLKIESIRGIDTLYDIWLRDKYLKDSLDIRRYGVYNFRINKSDTSSFGANRFELAIRTRPLAPYQLVDFKAEKVTEGIRVSWKTYNEGTYTGFTLQRNDVGGSSYYDLTQTQSNGNHTYSFIDRNPAAGINSYRLAQNDINSQVSYSAVVSIDNSLLAADSFMSIYPNPAVQTINLTVKSTEAGNCAANIYNTAGQLMMRRNVNTTVSVYDVSPLKPGTYLIQLTRSNGELIGQSKFIKN